MLLENSLLVAEVCIKKLRTKNSWNKELAMILKIIKCKFHER